MNEVADALAETLRKRLAIVADEASRREPQQHVQRLQEVSERIDDLRARLPKPVDPQLAHYLARASYTKALAFLEGNNAKGGD